MAAEPLLQERADSALRELQKRGSNDALRKREEAGDALAELADAHLNANELDGALYSAEKALFLTGFSHCAAEKTASRAERALLASSGASFLERTPPHHESNLPADLPETSVTRASSPDEFASVQRSDVPGLIDGIAHGWPAFQSWDLHELVRRAGHRYVPLEIESTLDGSWREETVPLKSFVEQYLCTCNVPVKELAYMAQHPLLTHLPSLWDDVNVDPNFISGGADAVQESHAWIGMRGTRTRLHRDNLENILVSIRGYKYVQLFHPSQASRLYVCGNSSPIDVEQPDFKSFPKFANARCETALIGPGDGLYIPAHWFHFVKNISAYSIALSLWW
jgi:lysine-specific demethylase 8